MTILSCFVLLICVIQRVSCVLKYVSSSSIEMLAGDVSSIRPTVSPVYAAYLAYGSCLGAAGPLSAFGPLGTLGPLGSNSWNPQYWISGIGDWSNFSQTITGEGGPLSQKGPLGSGGPLGNAYWNVLPKINDYGKQLQAFGIFTPLGPLGALGTLGPLGVLGPIGAHGFLRDLTSGAYVSNGTVQRQLSVEWTSGVSRVWELFEDYEQAFAMRMRDNDASWMVRGTVSAVGGYVEFPFYSRLPQYVTISVVPEYALDDWDLDVSLKNVNIATANSTFYMDFIQLPPILTTSVFTVRVTLAAHGHFLTPSFRLFVVGSHYINSSDITGNHQIPFGQ